MNDIYKKQVALLIRIMPSVYRIKDFAVHGGTAINLFHKNMPRYSVDIDLTYIPIQDRAESLNAINEHLKSLKASFEDGTPDWNKCCAGDLSNYPSVKWKLQNIGKLKTNNPQKHQQGIGKLMLFFGNQRK